MTNFYELLGVNEDASSEEIKSAYKQMVKKYHPDVNSGEDANKIIRSLNEAKEILLDSDRRSIYDRDLEEIRNSKQFSQERSETYKAKAEEYKETYSETYVTKWEFYVNYIKNSVDKWWIKILKSVLVTFNTILFFVLCCISYVLAYIFFISRQIIDYFAVFLFMIGVIYLFDIDVLKDIRLFNVISNNILGCILFCLLGVGVIFGKILLIKGSINLVVRLQILEDKLFMKIMTKI